MRKQSYYVWFLGAQEARGTGDERSVRPALKYLLEREKDIEPTKVTLQVSSKGLKIVQNILRSGSSKTAKKEQMKHLIPPHSLTNVMQADPPHEDIVCCTLLIYNPVTKCPVHVHAYRCDSVETASSLRYQLAQLMEHGLKAAATADQTPVDSESRLHESTRGPLPEGHMRPAHSRAPHSAGAARKQQQQPPIGSDGRSTRTDEEDPDFEGDVDDDDDEIGKSMYDGYSEGTSPSLGGHIGTTLAAAGLPPPPPAALIHGGFSRESCEIAAPQDPQMVRLYDSLAQELKAKLANGLKCNTQKAPLLLPPKDYDTVCRKQGNFMGIDFRRSTNQNIIGRPNSKNGSEGNKDDDVDDVDEALPPASRRDLSRRGAPDCLVSNHSTPTPGKSSSTAGPPPDKASKAPHVNTKADERLDEDWSFRPHEQRRQEGCCSEVRLRPRHRSLDFVQQRLDHFHMGEQQKRTTSPPERYRAANSGPRSPSKDAMATYFGQQQRPMQPLRSLSNNNTTDHHHHPPLNQLPSAPQTASLSVCYAGSGPFSLPSKNERSASRFHQERPISFPSGGNPLKRELNSLSRLSPQCLSFHQHPVKESMIEPVINNQHHRHHNHDHQQQRRRSSPGTRNPFEDPILIPSRKPDSSAAAAAASKSAYTIPPHRFPGIGQSPENLKPPSERPPTTDYRRQSLAEFRDGPHSGRDPVAKYLLHSPLERRAFRNRYSVAESNGHRLY